MGHLNGKYTKEYYLGGIDPLTHVHYGLSGYKEFNNHTIEKRFEKAFHFIKSFVGELKGKDILEVGFGRGELIPLFLQEKCQTYHGIDFSRAAINISQKQNDDPRVKLEILDAKDLNEENAYDVIVMNHVIEHIPAYELDKVWEMAKRALRPNGYIIIGTHVYVERNELDKTENLLPTMGIYCNKQTVRTISDACKKHGLICLQESQPYFGIRLKSSNQNQNSAIRLPSIKETGRLLIGCVAENSPKYRSQALKLVQSIRWFGGRMAGANIVVCMVDDVDPKFAAELEQWGVFVQVVKRFSEIHAPSNKIRFLELPETAFYDTIILMDCDTIIVSDPLDNINEGNFQATMVGMVNVTYSSFQKLFSHYNLPMPPQAFTTTIKDEPTIWYCNAGVLIFPQKILSSFLSTWKKYIYDLYENKHLLDKFFFCEQVALTLAYFTDNIPFEELPKEMNYHLNPKISHRGKKTNPVIIHYHRYFNKKGFIMEPKQDPYLLKMVQKFNKNLKRHKRNLKKMHGNIEKR